MIKSNGKNDATIEYREKKLKISVIQINTIAENEVMNRIETYVILDLHEKINIASLLTNAETWTLNKKEKEEIEKIEIQCLKRLFSLPLHTPTAALSLSPEKHREQKLCKKTK